MHNSLTAISPLEIPNKILGRRIGTWTLEQPYFTGFLLRIAFILLGYLVWTLPTYNYDNYFVFFADYSVFEVFFSQYALWMKSGFLPYVDFSFEFPPLAAVLILLPALVGPLNLYPLLFGLMMLPFEVLNIYLIKRITTQTVGDEWGAFSAWSYAVFPPLIFLAISRFDSVVTTFMLLALKEFYEEHRYSTSALYLAIGSLIKFFPIVLVPTMSVIVVRREGLKQIVIPGLIFALIIITALFPFLIIPTGIDGLFWMIEYHLITRPLDNGAIIVFIMFIPSLILRQNVYELCEPLIPVLFGVQVFVAIFFLIKIATHKNGSAYDLDYLFLYYFWFIVLGKVVNPQYFLSVVAIASLAKNKAYYWLSYGLLTIHWIFLWGAQLIRYPFRQGFYIPEKPDILS